MIRVLVAENSPAVREFLVRLLRADSEIDVAGTKPAETAGQGVHELGRRLKQMAAQYKVQRQAQDMLKEATP